MPLRITDGYRSYKRQLELYEQGRSTPGKIVTESRPGESLHNFGIAVDCCFNFRNDPYLETRSEDMYKFYWAEYGRFAEAHGLRWGIKVNGRIDRPHIEASYPIQKDELQMIYERGGIDAVFKELKRRFGE